MKEIRCCSFCGAECIATLVGAETVEMMCFDITMPLASPYDSKTGKRQYVYHYKCPNHKQKKWYQICSPHDDYDTTKIIHPSLPLE